MFELLLILLAKWDKLAESKKRSRKSEERVAPLCLGRSSFENRRSVTLDSRENEGKNRGQTNSEFTFMHRTEFDTITIFIFPRNQEIMIRKFSVFDHSN